MPKKTYDKLRIFLASPGDVTEERDRVKAVADELNQTNNLADSLGVTLQVLDWRTDASPAMGRAEEELLKQMPVKSWDIFIGILWLRFGTGSGGKDPESGRDYDSGTEEEFRLAYRSWKKTKRPKMLFYRGVKEVNPTTIDLEQYQKVDRFFQEFFPDGEHPGLYLNYKDADDFERKVRTDLNKLLLEYGDKVLKRSPKKSRRRKRPSSRNLGDLTQKYLDYIYKQHGQIRLFGFLSRANIDVRTLHVFVSLRFSDPIRRMHLGKAAGKPEQNDTVTPAMVLQKAMQRRKPLLILGGPGYGKTTLLKYYAVCCRLPEGRRRLSLQRNLIPIFISLRQVDPDKPFTKFLRDWAKQNRPDISATISETVFKNWLKDPGALVLLDGLDEVSELQTRKRICEWIDETVRDFQNSVFVITCRHTGYHELTRAADHNKQKPNPFKTNPLQYDVLSLDEVQQTTFLRQWFEAAGVVKLENYELDDHELRQQIREKAKRDAQEVMEHLRLEENKALFDLGTIPVLLQIIAIIWREQGKSGLSGERADMYSRSINYLLQHREEEKEIPVLLSAPKAQLVLRPLALWMQEVNKKDAPLEKVIDQIKGPLSDVAPGVDPAEFLKNIRDRAGVLVGAGADTYMFQHRSFQEYLAAIEIANQERVALLIDSFGDPWWQDTVLFSAGVTSPVIFPQFLRRFLRHEKNNGPTPPLLLQMMQEAAVKPLEPIREVVLDRQDLDWPPRYNALQCLRYMKSDEAIDLLESVLNDKEDKVADLARTILAEWGEERIAETPETVHVLIKDKQVDLPTRLHNPTERNAEYILIPGGKYKYSVTKTETEVAPLYFAKYPVTNKLYNRFIDYLSGKGRQSGLPDLPVQDFGQSLLEKAGKDNIEGMAGYLGKNPTEWAGKVRSRYHDDKRFNGDDQPVVGVTWYAAVAYCHWLTEMSARLRNPMLFRLPQEQEWEWAAAGREKDGRLREYPWGEPEPDDTRANYGGKVGQTTPVGAYPAGATPEGLMDMAGNVWEWQENWYDEDKAARALRGGAWGLQHGLSALRRSQQDQSRRRLGQLHRFSCGARPVLILGLCYSVHLIL